MATNPRNKKSKATKHSKFSLEKFLKALDSFWGRFGVIIAVLYMGFSFGCYYKESVLNHEHMAYDHQREDYWRTQLQEWQKKVEEKEEIIFTLREQNIQLLLINTDSLTLGKVKLYEK